MKTTIKILIIFLALGSFNSMANAQKHKKEIWKATGFSWASSDTVTNTYTLLGKDSVSVTVENDNCGCYSWVDFEGLTHSSKGIIRKHLMANFWKWQKSYTISKKDTIGSIAPHWETTQGMASTVDGVYTQNGKFIQPNFIITKYGKLKVN